LIEGVFEEELISMGDRGAPRERAAIKGRAQDKPHKTWKRVLEKKRQP